MMGRKIKQYTALPSGMEAAEYYLDSAPDEHLGKPITDKSAKGLCHLYLDYLQNLVSEAINKYGKA
jgi:hypothetical protein